MECSDMLSESLIIYHFSNSSSSKKKFDDFELSCPRLEKILDSFLDLVASECDRDSIFSVKVGGSLAFISILLE